MKALIDPITHSESQGALAYLVGSVASRVPLVSPLELTSEKRGRHGDVVLVRVTEVNATYPSLETPEGKEIALGRGQLLIGALGSRKALHGFSGSPPSGFKPNMALHLLNKGGVIGECSAFHRDLGWPTQLEYLSTLSWKGRPANLEDFALPLIDEPLPEVPVVPVLGTGMDAGKTSVCKQLLKPFSEKGFSINAGKVAGVACRRDILSMKKNGAGQTLSFEDFGFPSTIQLKALTPVARSMIHYLAASKPNFIVLEMGDGILGGYHVSSLFEDTDFLTRCVSMIVCANDLMGTWGALQWLSQLDHRKCPVLISGRVTDSAEGVRYIEEKWNLPAANAFDSAGKICTFIQESLMPWLKSE